MIKEKSCGAVVYKLEDNQIYILIEKMKRGHYSIPKGHVEKGETEIETALREIKEETNLEVSIDSNFREVVSYSPYSGCIKDVVFFVAEAKSDILINQEIEVSELKWLKPAEAIDILTFDSDKEIIKKALKYLGEKNMNKHKKILTIQDISCFGQCSLTVASPIISAMGIEACILPSAILSTHTYNFKDFTFRDLTEDLPLIAEHWKKENITFDGIYTGYIGSTKQIGYIKQIIKEFKKENDIVCVDPAMADHGKLYYGFDTEFVKEMKTLCAMADYIVPNITEACFLLERPYLETYTKEDIESLLKELSTIGAPNVLLTGVSFKEGELGVASYNKEKDEITYYFRNKVPYFFHGTGDVYASSFFGALINDKNTQVAMKIATDFTVDAILETVEDRDTHWYGVHFEKALPKLIKSLNEE